MAEATLAPPLSNNPPMTESAKMAIDTALLDLKPRYDELMESLAKAKCSTPEESGKCADLVKMLTKHEKKYDQIRKDIKEPYDDAVKVIDAAPKPFRLALTNGAQTVRNLMLAFDKKQREDEAKAAREAAEKQRQEEADRRAEEQRRADAAAAAGVTVVAPEPEPEPEPEPLPAPRGRKPTGVVAQGDYGAAANRTVRKVPVIVDVYALPPEILNAPRVHDAILTVVRAMRQANPDAEIKGIEIKDEHGLAIR